MEERENKINQKYLKPTKSNFLEQKQQQHHPKTYATITWFIVSLKIFDVFLFINSKIFDWGSVLV